MSKQIAVSTNRLGSDAASMENRLNSVEKKMQEMYEAVRSLDATWEGESHNEFVRQFATDEQNMSELCKVLRDLIRCVVFAKDEYVKCENEVSSIVSSLKI